jgi:hypothetical protein
VSLQLVQLHFRSEPVLDIDQLKLKVEAYLGETVDTSGEDGNWLILHTNHRAEYEEGNLPAQTTILKTKVPNPPDREIIIQQSWSCSDAAERLEDCTHALLVTEMMARALPPVERVEIFHGVLRAVTELTSPTAMIFSHAQQVVAPEDYLEACDQPPMLRPGPLNVRFFNISGSDDEMVMDTRGLDELGLPDLQCHFRDLDPEQVHQVVFNTAYYIFENGPVIESGQTVPGARSGSRWSCQYVDSLLKPQRVVLDLNPGKRNAGGNR